METGSAPDRVTRKVCSEMRRLKKRPSLPGARRCLGLIRNYIARPRPHAGLEETLGGGVCELHVDGAFGAGFGFGQRVVEAVAGANAAHGFLERRAGVVGGERI